MNYDFSAFSGHWPYRFLRRSGISEQLREYEALGFSGGCMSSLDAIFYNDPWEADGPMLQALSGTGWKLAMCVNPQLPWTEQAVRHAHGLGVRHLRLYPGIHHYPLDSAAELCRLAEELHMAILITGRMEDERLCYLLNQHSVSAEACIALAAQFPNVPFLLSGFYLNELMGCCSVPDNLWTDTSGLCHGLNPVQELIKGGFPDEKILFGSLSPLQCLHSHLLNLPREHQTDILSTNPRRFLEVCHDRLRETSHTF